MNVALLLHGQAHPVLEPKSWALPVLTLHSSSQGWSCRSEIRLNSAVLQQSVKKYLMLQVTANSDHRQSYHSEVKLRFLHQIKQKHTRVT